MTIKEVLFMALLFTVVKSQKDIGRNVRDKLQECYNDTFLGTRDIRLPSTLNVLIDLIRRVEDSKTVLDIRSISLDLVHRFRQDGIVRLPSKNNLSLPFSPNGYQTDRSRLLLFNFLPGDTKSFPEDSLNSLEKCSFHFMLSNMFETRTRGDESTVCYSLGRYTRRTRAVDAEMINHRKNEDIETISKPIPRGYDQNDISECPVEGGVVYTKYGSVQAGAVISAIAASFENQVLEYSDRETSSIFVATFTGDLAETALQQGIMDNTYEIGAKGGWNSTLVPRWYFVRDKLNQMTDAEIRGDMDGLIMAMNMKDWKNKAQNIKLSQILDMYYSPRGVFSKFRACNRNAEITAYTANDKLKNEAIAFAHMYSVYADVKGTVNPKTIPDLVEPALKAFNSYAASLHENCEANTTLEKIATEVIIVIDTDWPYKIIQPALAHLLDQLEINKYESNYTVLSGGNGDIIIDGSYSILEFHENYTEEVYNELNGGFLLTDVMPIVEKRLETRLEGEKTLGKTSGKSQLVLFVPYLKSLPNGVSSFVQTRMADTYRNLYPDVKLLVLGAGNKDSYASLVNNAKDDIFILPETTTNEEAVKTKVSELVNRIRQIPRKISNPRCGGYMSGDISTNAVELYAEQGTISYYKISPNYFFGDGARAVNLLVQTESLTVCTSRSEPQPREGSSTNCKQVGAGGKEIYDLSDTCLDTIISCPPFYFSVQAPIVPNSNARCSDPGCRYPDSIKFSVTLENAVCRSGAGRVLSSILLMVTMLALLKP